MECGAHARLWYSLNASLLCRMSKTELLEQGLAFGPFKTEHHQRSVDDRFRKALLSWLTINILPQVEGAFTRVEGRLYSHYDNPKFLGPDSILQHRYYFQIKFQSPEGTEEAWGEVDYDRAHDTFTPTKIKPSHVRTLSAQRHVREMQDQALRILERIRQGERDIPCPNCGSRLEIWIMDNDFIKNIACPQKGCFLVHFD
jgi:hypothetical protein